MYAVLIHADDVLRRRAWTVETHHAGRALLLLVGLILFFGVAYGAVMGSFGGLSADRILQVVYSAVKVPLLLLVTFGISLPSFFVLNTLFGLRTDFEKAVRALIATQAGVAITLASLAPFTILWYVSFSRYQTAVLFNAAMFAIASFSGQWLLRAYYRPLIDRNRRHLVLLWAWIVVYAFVGIQLGWILRPFIGDPTSPAQFFRDEVWGNAYVIVWQAFWNTVLR